MIASLRPHVSMLLLLLPSRLMGLPFISHVGLMQTWLPWHVRVLIVQLLGVQGKRNLPFTYEIQ